MRFAVKKYRIADVEAAIGLSEDTIRGYFNNRKISCKGGLTIAQIAEVCAMGRRRNRGKKVDPQAVQDIRTALRTVFEICDDGQFETAPSLYEISGGAE